jgi:hypothetical protein
VYVHDVRTVRTDVRTPIRTYGVRTHMYPHFVRTLFSLYLYIFSNIYLYVHDLYVHLCTYWVYVHDVRTVRTDVRTSIRTYGDRTYMYVRFIVCTYSVYVYNWYLHYICTYCTYVTCTYILYIRTNCTYVRVRTRTYACMYCTYVLAPYLLYIRTVYPYCTYLLLCTRVGWEGRKEGRKRGSFISTINMN